MTEEQWHAYLWVRLFRQMLIGRGLQEPAIRMGWLLIAAGEEALTLTKAELRPNA